MLTDVLTNMRAAAHPPTCSPTCLATCTARTHTPTPATRRPTPTACARTAVATGACACVPGQGQRHSTAQHVLCLCAALPRREGPLPQASAQQFNPSHSRCPAPGPTCLHLPLRCRSNRTHNSCNSRATSMHGHSSNCHAGSRWVAGQGRSHGDHLTRTCGCAPAEGLTATVVGGAGVPTQPTTQKACSTPAARAGAHGPKHKPVLSLKPMLAVAHVSYRPVISTGACCARARRPRLPVGGAACAGTCARSFAPASPPLLFPLAECAPLCCLRRLQLRAQHVVQAS